MTLYKKRERGPGISWSRAFFSLLLLCLSPLVLTSCEKKEEGLILGEEALSGEVASDRRVEEEKEEQPPPESSPDLEKGEESSGRQGQEIREEKKEPDLIFVHVCGAVEKEGVYSLREGSRVYEAIALAGGLRETADGSFLNQAAPLSDGLMVRVPTKEEATLWAKEGGTRVLSATVSETIGSGQGAAGSLEPGFEQGKVNINKATREELETLPGIGKSLSSAILSYREDKGSFERIEDIMKVTGIKEKLFSKIKDRIVV